MEHTGAQSRPKEETNSTLRSSPEAGMRSTVGFDIVAAVNVMKWSSLSCTCIDLAQWRHQRKYQINCQIHSGQFAGSKATTRPARPCGRHVATMM
jgi:hypothetical protein